MSELFPTRMRGLACAIILFFGKMLGSVAPFLATMSKNHNLHIVCGCSVVLLISIPLSFCIDETLVLKNIETNKVNEEEEEEDENKIGLGLNENNNSITDRNTGL